MAFTVTLVAILLATSLVWFMVWVLDTEEKHIDQERPVMLPGKPGDEDYEWAKQQFELAGITEFTYKMDPPPKTHGPSKKVTASLPELKAKAAPPPPPSSGWGGHQFLSLNERRLREGWNEMQELHAYKDVIRGLHDQVRVQREEIAKLEAMHQAFIKDSVRFTPVKKTVVPY